MRAALVALVLLAPVAAAQEFPDGAQNWFGHSPIRVFIDATNVTEPGYLDQARAALRWWENGGNGRLAWDARFAVVQDRADADIILWFRDATRSGPLCEEDTSALGCARPFERPVPIEVLTRDHDGTLVAYELMRQVVEHEVGHAIGFPHSSIPGDIMAPHASSFASRTYAPDDLPRILGGAALMLALIGLIGWFGWRAMRRVGEVRPLAAGEACSDGGEHEFAPMVVRVGREDEVLDVCSRCSGARRRGPS